MARSNDGRFVKTYAVLSWIFLRVYALTFLGLAYVAMQWLNAEDPQIAALALGQDPVRAAIVLAFVGVVLLLPPLTPRFVALPRSILAGFLGAAAIAGLSYYLTLTVPFVLSTNVVPDATLPTGEVVPYVQPVVMGMAGIFIACMLLVSAAVQIATARHRARSTTNRHEVQQDLRTLRHVRMHQP